MIWVRVALAAAGLIGLVGLAARYDETFGDDPGTGAIVLVRIADEWLSIACALVAFIATWWACIESGGFFGFLLGWLPACLMWWLVARLWWLVAFGLLWLIWSR